MPDVAAATEQGVLASWVVDESARFDAAQTIAYVETEDELFSVEAGRPGILVKALVWPGTPVDPGSPIGVLAEPWEEVHDVDALLLELGLPVPGLSGLGVVEPAAVGMAVAGRARRPTTEPAHPPGPFPMSDPVALLEESTELPAVEPQREAEPSHHFLRVTVRVDRLVALAGELERAGRPGSRVIDLVERAVSGAHRQVPQVGVARLESDRAAVPGIAISHPGRFGVEEAAAVIPAGHVAALAVGSVRDEPVVEGDAVVPGKRMTVTLTVSPGGVDDAVVSRWLAVLSALLERPEWMVE